MAGGADLRVFITQLYSVSPPGLSGLRTVLPVITVPFRPFPTLSAIGSRRVARCD